MDFISIADISRDYDLGEDSLSRHFRYYDLHLKRVDDTKKVMKKLLSKGMELLDNDVLELRALDVIGAAKHLDALEGRVQEKRQNETDREMKKRQYELAVNNIITRSRETEFPVDRRSAIDLLESRFPDIREYLPTDPERIM